MNKTKGCLIANFATVPAQACSLLLAEQADDAELRETIFSSIPKSRLAESVSKVNELARPQNNNFHDEMGSVPAEGEMTP
ncbi:hypothetical protein [Klebsiella variicola]|uniref:hypothetical protein n=1 Tax=Klebsiella variicola TaxID=244366 RepID=UPI00097E4177|nr:hypothetical protein [Klebsiella variicola]